MGDGTLRLIEKASSCRQMVGHGEVNNRGRPGRQLPLEEKQGRGNQRSQVPDQGEVGRVPGLAVPRPPGQHEKEKGSERTWIGSGSYARGALARRGERTGTPAPPPGRRIRPEETASTALYCAHRPPSRGRGLNTHGDKARAGRRGNTW